MAERELRDAQDALRSFQRTNNFTILHQEGAVAGSYLATLKTRLSDLQIEDGVLKGIAPEQGTNAAASRRVVQLKMENVQRCIQEWESKAVQDCRLVAEVERLKENVQRSQSTFERLVVLLRNIDISRNVDLDPLSILEPASVAVRSYTPETRLRAITGLGGLALGLGMVTLAGWRGRRSAARPAL